MNRYGREITDEGIRERFSAALQQAACSSGTFHDLRHTYAITMLDRLLRQLDDPERGERRALLALKRLMGHLDSRSTEIYLQAREIHLGDLMADDMEVPEDLCRDRVDHFKRSRARHRHAAMTFATAWPYPNDDEDETCASFERHAEVLGAVVGQLVGAGARIVKPTSPTATHRIAQSSLRAFLLFLEQRGWHRSQDIRDLTAALLIPLSHRG